MLTVGAAVCTIQLWRMSNRRSPSPGEVTGTCMPETPEEMMRP